MGDASDLSTDGVPAITATSMITAPAPTRAEVNDAANAVFDGTDALMLSGKTSIGRDLAHVVRTMARIAASTEADADWRSAGLLWQDEGICHRAGRGDRGRHRCCLAGRPRPGRVGLLVLDPRRTHRPRDGPVSPAAQLVAPQPRRRHCAPAGSRVGP